MLASLRPCIVPAVDKLRQFTLQSTAMTPEEGQSADNICQIREAELTATLLRRALAANGRTWLTVNGRSMAPLLRPGDQILLEPVAAADLRPGDILTVNTPQGLLTHRLHRAGANGLLLAGDRLPRPDPPCAQTAVVGRVIARRRNAQQLSLTSGPGRRLNAALAVLTRFTPRSRLAGRGLRLLAACLTWLAETAVTRRARRRTKKA